MTTFTQLTARLKNFLMNWLFVLGLVECATLCVKSEVILTLMHSIYIRTVRWSTCLFSCWLLNHAIHLKLRKKSLLAKLCKLKKMTTATIFSQFWLKIVAVVIFLTTSDHFELKKLPFCKFAHLTKQLFISQLEINHMIQQPTAKN